MAVEIERKFLVTGSAYQQSGKRTRITQGYITTGPDVVIRVRIYDDKSFITFKSRSTGFSRKEYEFQIDLQNAREMLEQFCHRPFIDKYRYIVEYKGFIWEVDEFLQENRGLIVAEIELPSEETPFERPDWVGEEVTHDPKYFNSKLTEHPYNSWNKGK